MRDRAALFSPRGHFILRGTHRFEHKFQVYLGLCVFMGQAAYRLKPMVNSGFEVTDRQRPKTYIQPKQRCVVKEEQRLG